MLRSVSGVGSTQQARCTLCHTTSSASTSLPSTHYGSPSPRARASSVQPLQSLQSNNRLLKPVALKDLSNSSSFRTGQSLRRFTPLKNAGPFENKTSLRWQKIEANALDAGQSGAADAYPEESVIPGGEQDEITTAKAAAQRLKIGTYFVLWWSLNVVFNIYNKKVLNVFPYPWLTSTLSLAAGSTIMLLSWATRLAAAPELDVEFWKNLAPVALAHTIGHVAATVSMSKVAVSFTHIIKSSEPAFSVLISRFLLGETFPLPVYLSLLPIIGGCALTAATELNFNVTGFVGAMISNIAFVFRNIFSKRGMVKSNKVGGMNYYACLSMLSLAFLTPFAFAVEGPKLWASGWQQATQTVGQQFFWWVMAQSVFYHLYNQVSYMSLNEISPLTFSIGNTMKRVTVIVSSIIVFHTPVLPVNAVGAAIAIFGTFLYSQAKQ
jgi:solute carrier family 35 protein E1